MMVTITKEDQKTVARTIADEHKGAIADIALEYANACIHRERSQQQPEIIQTAAQVRIENADQRYRNALISVLIEAMMMLEDRVRRRA